MTVKKEKKREKNKGMNKYNLNCNRLQYLLFSSLYWIEYRENVWYIMKRVLQITHKSAELTAKASVWIWNIFGSFMGGKVKLLQPSARRSARDIFSAQISTTENHQAMAWVSKRGGASGEPAAMIAWAKSLVHLLSSCGSNSGRDYNSITDWCSSRFVLRPHGEISLGGRTSPIM